MNELILVAKKIETVNFELFVPDYEEILNASSNAREIEFSERAFFDGANWMLKYIKENNRQ